MKAGCSYHGGVPMTGCFHDDGGGVPDLRGVPLTGGRIL